MIAVRVNTTGGRPRWYAGAGIYRHVWLQAFNPVHITTYGTYITTPSVSTDKAEVHIVTTMKNSTDKTQTLTISQQVLDARGKAVTQNDSKKLTLPSQDTSGSETDTFIESSTIMELGESSDVPDGDHHQSRF